MSSRGRGGSQRRRREQRERRDRRAQSQAAARRALPRPAAAPVPAPSAVAAKAPAKAPTKAVVQAASDKTPGPSGIGTGVAFDWGLTAELLTFALLFVVGKMGGGSGGAGLRVAGAAGSVVGAGLTFALGEGLRRGRRPAWLAQVALNTLALPAGFILLPGTIADLRQGHFGSSVPTAILLFVDPALVWLLTRARTRAWLRTTTSAQAAARHGGRWLLGVGAYALVGGVAVALSRYY